MGTRDDCNPHALNCACVSVENVGILVEVLNFFFNLSWSVCLSSFAIPSLVFLLSASPTSSHHHFPHRWDSGRCWRVVAMTTIPRGQPVTVSVFFFLSSYFFFFSLKFRVSFSKVRTLRFYFSHALAASGIVKKVCLLQSSQACVG